MSKDRIRVTLLLYVGATVGFMFLLFMFFSTQGLSLDSFLIAMVIFVPAIASVGYLLLSDMREGKLKQDERLEHMTREVLHEINLPISTIQSNLQMLDSRIEDPKDRKRLERIKGSTNRLIRLYDLLSYNIKREISAVEAEKFDISEIIRQRVSVFEDMQRNKFKLDLSHLEVFLDKIGFEQVLDNLIINSMKYSASDSLITIRVYDTYMKIIDNGVGMDGAQIARIYERYYQGDSHSPGEGIGLALVKRYCDENSIDLKISSEPGKGTDVILDMTKVTKK